MVTFKCEQKDCANKYLEYNFLGNSETAMCGGCKETLIAFDLRDDPEDLFFNGFTN